LKDLDATAPSKSERDWLERSQRPPELEITGVIDSYIYIYLNGTEWNDSYCEKLREIAG
jgi:hypothetical protein